MQTVVKSVGKALTITEESHLTFKLSFLYGCQTISPIGIGVPAIAKRFLLI
jgi:hypothetical protein